jgi:hypothetical protein
MSIIPAREQAEIYIFLFLLILKIPIPMKIIPTGKNDNKMINTAQVNNNKQTESKLVTVNTSNFFDLKKDVKFGINEYAHIREANTTKTKREYDLLQGYK